MSSDDMTGAGSGRDLLGRPLAGTEAELMEVYKRLRALVERDDLPPCAAANLRHALSYYAIAVTDLALDYEHLLDLGV